MIIIACLPRTAAVRGILHKKTACMTCNVKSSAATDNDSYFIIPKSQSSTSARC